MSAVNARNERLARGEEVTPEEPGPTAEVEIGLWGLMNFLLRTIVPVGCQPPPFLATRRWELKRARPLLTSPSDVLDCP